MRLKLSGRKAKGKKFEKDVANKLHEFLIANNQEYQSLFEQIGNDNVKPKRDTSSGTFSNSDNDIDLGIAKKFFPFAIECKHNAIVSGMTLTTVFKRNISFIEKTMKQATTHAEKSNLTPLIVMKGNYSSTMVVFHENHINHCLSSKIERLQNDNIDYIKVNQMYIVEFDQFLKLYFNVN